MKVKYFTKQALIDANAKAILTNRNRTLYPEPLERLPDLKFPVGFSFPHNDYEMRVSLLVGPSADQLQSVWLDIPFKTFNNLPEAEVPE